MFAAWTVEGGLMTLVERRYNPNMDCKYGLRCQHCGPHCLGPWLIIALTSRSNGLMILVELA